MVPPEVEAQAVRLLEKGGMPAERLAAMLRKLADGILSRGRKPFDFELRVHGKDGHVTGVKFDPGAEDI